MRIVLQRVKSASVSIDGAAVASIDRGLLLLLGFSAFDAPAAAPEALGWLARKVLAARVFPAADGSRQWAASAKSLGLPVLLVSQFTLHGNLRKPKPDFHRAAGTEGARALWEAAVGVFTRLHAGGRVAVGVFGADMDVRLCNWGPVTLTLDSANKKEAYWEEGGGGGGGAGAQAGGQAAGLEGGEALGEASEAAASGGSAGGASDAK